MACWFFQLRLLSNTYDNTLVLKRSICLVLSIFLLYQAQGQDSGFAEADIEELYDRGLTLMYSDRDSTDFYLGAAAEMAFDLEKPELVLDIINAKLRTAEYYFDLENYKTNLDELENLIGNESFMKQDSTLDIPHYRNKLLIDQGAYYYSLGNLPKAKPFFGELLNRLDTISISILDSYQINHMVTSLSFLGAIHQKLARVNMAESYYEKQVQALNRFKDSVSNYEVYLYHTKGLLAGIHLDQNNTDEGLREISEAIEYYKTQDSDYFVNSLVGCLLSKAELELSRDSLNLALRDLDSVELLVGSEHHLSISKKNLLGDWFLKMGDYPEARKAYKEVLQQTIAFRKTTKHKDVAEIHVKLGKLARKRGNPQESLVQLQNALKSASYDFSETDASSSPEPEEVFSKNQLMIILKEKLEVLNLLLSANPDEELLKAANYTSKRLLATMDNLRPEFESKLDKEFLIEQAYPGFHSMLRTAYFGYEKTEDQSYLEDAVLYLEKSKGILLMDAVRNAEALSFGSVPDTILTKEMEYRAYITNTEKDLLKAGESEKNKLKDSLFDLKANYAIFLNRLEEKYPKYHRLKYDIKTVSLSDIQSYLGNKEALISYHQTDEELFAVVLKKSDTRFIRIPLSQTLSDGLVRFARLLSKPSSRSSQEIKELGTLIHSNIVAPCLDDGTINSLTIIPDGLLNYLPFEALTDNTTGKYLVEQMPISLANSATLLAHTRNNEIISSSSVLSISPNFKISSNFSQLPFAENEAKSILKHFPGKILSGDNASISRFQNEKDDYSIFHFATHAVVDDENPDFSFLAFASDTDNKNRLFVKDLYDYNLSVDMVTLSACETGIGKLRNGEGMLSLARGFQYAGVPSLTITLWKNDDQTTAEIMDSYYKYLKEGYTKSKALQKVKLEYLETTEETELKHPYYWAGFVVLGDNAPLSDKTCSPWIIAALLISVFLIGFLAYRTYPRVTRN